MAYVMLGTFQTKDQSPPPVRLGDIKKETRVRQHQWQLLTTREWFETFQPIKVSHHETTTMT